MGYQYMDVLKCRVREPLYNLKKQNKNVNLEDLGFYTIDIIPTNKNVYFIDNVYASGLTARAANSVFSKGEIVVYAYDETLQ